MRGRAPTDPANIVPPALYGPNNPCPDCIDDLFTLMVKKYHKRGLDDASHSSNGVLDFPKPHDNLSPIVPGTPFSSRNSESRSTALKSQVPHWGYSPTPFDRGLASTTQDKWAFPINKAASAPISIITSDLEAVDFRTVIHHRQVTPGDSPEEGLSSPQKSAESAMARWQSRKEKAIATATTVAASASSAMSEEGSTGSQGGSETKVKKQPKPRRSDKKRTTAEQAAAKWETAKAEQGGGV